MFIAVLCRCIDASSDSLLFFFFFGGGVGLLACRTLTFWLCVFRVSRTDKLRSSTRDTCILGPSSAPTQGMMIGARQLLSKYATLLPSVEPPIPLLNVGCDGLAFRV